MSARVQGEVFLAEDTELERKVALKFLPESLQSDPTALARLRREAKSAAALDHPYICKVYEVGESEDARAFIAMEYVAGETLAARMEREPLHLIEALGIAVEMVEALAKAHERGIVHRDLKPANVMLGLDGHIKVMDFGLAREFEPQPADSDALTRSKLTKEGSISGTVGYMSPEQARGERTDARSDLFSFGVVLYEMVFGVRAFEGRSAADALSAVLRDDPFAHIPQGTVVPSQVSDVIRRCLEKEADQRVSSARDLRLVLTRAKDETKTDSSAADIPRIVVLPLVNLSPDPDNEYFSDGLTHEIIADLSGRDAVQVIATRSSMLLKGTDKNLRQLGQELNVQYALEGSVRKAGRALRVTAELVDIGRDIPVWSEKFDGTVDDVFTFQERIARAVADGVKVELEPAEKRGMRKHQIDNAKAYDCYLRAQQDIYRLTETSLDRAKELVENGLSLIGDNELLFATLGNIHFQYVNVTIRASEGHLDQAERYADRALAMNPGSSHALCVRGLVAYKRADIISACGHLNDSLAANPDNTDALFWLAYLYSHVGRSWKARPHAERLCRLDPLVPINHGVVGLVELMDGRFDETLPHYRRWHEMEPDHPFGLWCYAFVLIQAGERADGLKLLASLPLADPPSVWDSFGLALRHALHGDAEAVVATITPELHALLGSHEQFSWHAARFYSLAGMKDVALTALRNAMRLGFINYPFVSTQDPFLEALRGEAEFDELMIEMKTRWEEFPA
jgi:serine/threonine protein kinase/tetratricopeptide (TPR) repeat protein